jgi:hypothetical protein
MNINTPVMIQYNNKIRNGDFTRETQSVLWFHESQLPITEDFLCEHLEDLFLIEEASIGGF